jgi:peptidoglycan/xylan/chitin deacetylase (PgdA/CDA1 family)
MKQLLVRISRKAQTLIKRGQPLVVALGLLAGISIASIPAAHASALSLTATPKVSFTFDDGYESFITQAAPTLAAHNLTGTAYVTTGYVGTPNFMTWEQVEALQNDWNWEIGAHTLSHPELPLLSPEEQDNELRASKELLATHGIDAVSFATPFGAYDDSVLATSARYYTSHRGFHDAGYNNYPYNDQVLINQQVQIGDGDEAPGVTVDQVKGYVDEAIANDQWLVLTFHDITELPIVPANADEAYSYPKESLSEIAAYVASKVATQSISAINIRDGLITGTNMLPNGNFNNGIADGWLTDSPANVTVDDNNNGSYPGPTRSIALNAGGTNAHLFSPKIDINSANSYLIKNFLKITAMAGGEVSFYVDEYGVATEANPSGWISGQYHAGVVYPTADGIYVRNVNFLYVPTSAEVVKASLQIIVTGGSGVQAYLDNVQWINTNEEVVVPPTDTTAPVVSAVAHSNITASGATISWTTDEASDSRVDYGITDAYGANVAATTLGTSHSLELTGLDPNTSYHYKVTSKDAAGNTTVSGDLTFTTAELPPVEDTVPPVIEAVVATGITTTGATISWGTLAESATGEVRYSTTTDFSSSTPILVTDLASSHSVALTGLTPNTPYYFQIVAKDAAGNVAQTPDGVNAFAFSTLAETPEEDVIPPFISNVSFLGSMLTWNTDELTTSRIDYGTTTTYDLFAESDVTTFMPWFTLPGLAPDTIYYYQITSTDLTGNSSTYVGSFNTNPQNPGDINGDGVVNLNDLSILSSNWGSESATRAQGDLNGDGKVNLNDLSILSDNWSQK